LYVAVVLKREKSDGQTDITKLIAAYRIFWNAPKKDEIGSARDKLRKDLEHI
jgi:hypothetical protein